MTDHAPGTGPQVDDACQRQPDPRAEHAGDGAGAAALAPGNTPLLIAEEQLAKVKVSLGTALPAAEDESSD